MRYTLPNITRYHNAYYKLFWDESAPYSADIAKSDMQTILKAINETRTYEMTQGITLNTRQIVDITIEYLTDKDKKMRDEMRKLICKP